MPSFMPTRPRWRRVATRRLVVATCVSLLVIADYLVLVGMRRQTPVALPTPRGPYHVGRLIYDWTDTSRVELLSPRPGGHRELSVWLWYPAASAVGPPAAYAPGAWRGLHLPEPIGWFESDFTKVGGHARQDVSVADGKFPIVVLEPGMGFAAPQYTALAEDLASRGYVVAGLTPTYSANFSVLHGKPVGSTAAGNPPDLGKHHGPGEAEASRLLDTWAADAHFVASKTVALDRTRRFSNRIDPANVVYVGHSFGGAASLQACLTDPHCQGAVDVDGTQFGTVVHQGLSAPIMILGSEGSCVTGTCQPRNADERADRAAARSLLAASTGSKLCFSITGTKHLNFTDDAVLYLAAPIRFLYPLGGIHGSHGLTIQSALLADFLDQTSQRPDGLAASPSPRYKEAADYAGICDGYLRSPRSTCIAGRASRC